MMGVTAAAGKKALRGELKKRINDLTAVQKEAESLAISKKLFSSQVYKQSKNICVYLSMSSEVDTTRIIKNIFEQNKTCYVPWYSTETMKFLKLNSFEDFETLPLTAWKIKQPSDQDAKTREEALESGKLDLVIVPGLGFGKEGSRLGRGKGYYDRYLARCKKSNNQISTIGLSFNCQWCDDIPMDKYDLPLNYIITAEKMSNFGTDHNAIGA